MRSLCRVLGPVLAIVLVASARADVDPELEKKVRAALDEGNPRTALPLIEKALGAKPNDPDLLALRGETRLDLGKTKEAKADFEKCAKAGAKQAAKVAGMRARIEFLYGNDAAARKLLEDAPEDDADKATLPILIDGPFVEPLGDAAPIAVGKSSNGHYLIYSDIGLTPALLEAAKTTAAAEKAKGENGLAGRLAGVLKPLPGVKEGGKLMEIIYKSYDNVFPFEKDAKLLHRVYIFTKREDFIAFAKSIGEDMEGADGFYRSDTRILAIDGEEDKEGKEVFAENTRDTMFHEGFHQFVRFHAPGLPTWLDEGLAEYFGPSRVLPSGKLEVGVIKKTAKSRSTRLEDIREALKEKQAPRLEKFLQLSDEDFMKEELQATHYAQAWAVLHFLISKEDKRPLVVDYFKAIRAGKTREQAFAETFGKIDLKELDKDWRKYVDGL